MLNTKLSKILFSESEIYKLMKNIRLIEFKYFLLFFIYIYIEIKLKISRNSVQKAKAFFVLTNGVNDATGIKR